MEEQNVYMAQDEQEIDLMELFQKLLERWKYILTFTVCAGVLGFVAALSIVKNYNVHSTLAPEVVARSSASMASLAAMAGINLNTTNTIDAVYPELYPDIVKSNKFLVELFSTPVEFMDKKEGLVKTDYYTYMKDYNRVPWWSHVIGAPFKAVSWFVGLFKEEPEEEAVEGYAEVDPVRFTKEQNGIAKAISSKIKISVDNKTSIIDLTVNAQHPEVAYEVSEKVIEKIKEYVSAYRTEKARNNMVYFEQLFAEAQKDYYDAQQKYAHYVDANQGVVLQSVKTERERLRYEMELNFNLYKTCAQQLQASKAKLQQETPVFAVIYPPAVPLRSANSRMMPLVAITFLGFCCACAWVLFIKDFFAKLLGRKEEEE